MKKLLGMILTLALAAGLAWPVYAESSTVPPEVTAHAYLVMDAQTGQVLVQKGGAERNYPASITKIMTLALAMEKCGGDMTQQVTVSPDAVYSLEAGSSHVALQPGEVVSLNDLFHATILASANDAANVLAEYTAGSMEAFVELMNAKAAELGLAGTHFVNANGLHSADHYTTPYDMARLTQWAMTVPGFSELFGATSYTMQPTNKQEQERLFGTDNCMLVTNKYQYEGTTGGKSGWTEEAGYTMVETVTRSGRSLICVVMGSAKSMTSFPTASHCWIIASIISRPSRWRLRILRPRRCRCITPKERPRWAARRWPFRRRATRSCSTVRWLRMTCRSRLIRRSATWWTSRSPQQ